MKEFSLTPFASSDFTRRFTLDASAAFHKSQAFLKWTLYGPTQEILLLEEDDDALWKHTCFEFFLALEKESYLEWNFAPSGAVNTYSFESYRKAWKISNVPFEGAVKVSESSKTNNRFIHEVELDLNLIPFSKTNTPSGSLTCVLESSKNEISYWANLHPKEKPDFHLKSCFQPLI